MADAQIPRLDLEDVTAICDALQIAVDYYRHGVEVNIASGNPALETLIQQERAAAESAGATLMKFSFLASRGKLVQA